MNDDANDRLDDLLAQARWPATPPQATQRLAERWERLRSRNRRRSLWWSGAAVAAGVVIAVSVVVPPMHNETRPVAIAPPAQPASPAPITQLPGRAPTARELILLRAAERGVAIAPPTSLPRVAPDAALDEVELARSIAHADGRISDELAERLSRVATQRSLPLLLKLWRDPKLRPAAVDALARLADARSLAAAARDCESAERRKLIAALLNRPHALALFLELVSDERTRADALAAVARVDPPPVEDLFMSLQSPRADLRLAAAWTLGQINGPAVTAELIRMIDAGRSRREAFIALAASRGSEARAFLRQAAESNRFSSLARSAMAQTMTFQSLRSQS